MRTLSQWSLPYHLLQCPTLWLHVAIGILIKIKVAQNVTLATFQVLSSHVGLEAQHKRHRCRNSIRNLDSEQQESKALWLKGSRVGQEDSLGTQKLIHFVGIFQVGQCEMVSHEVPQGKPRFFSGRKLILL